MKRVANLLPVDVGEKRTPTVSVASGSIVKLVSCPSARANWPGLAPPMVRSETAIGVEPVLVICANRGAVGPSTVVLNTSRLESPSTSSAVVTFRVGAGPHPLWVTARSVSPTARPTARLARR